MSDLNDKSSGLLDDDKSHAYASMHEGGRKEGFLHRLRHRSPHLVLPLIIALAVAVIAIVALLLVNMWKKDTDSGTPVPNHHSIPLHSYVTIDNANRHLNGLQMAADIGNGTRQTNTKGYNASLDYISGVLNGLSALKWRFQHWTELGRSGINLIADTVTGDPANTIVMGGHLDSFGGPGLNDDGSGSVAVLLLAAAVNDAILNGNLTLTNRIRFHWYDAEEAGLRGSRAAVNLGINATDVGERLKDWVCQMQADMVAAPNYILGVVDPTFLPTVPNSTVAGSHVMARMFRDQFVALGYPHRNITRYHSQSDQWSYWTKGVPAAFGITGVYEIHTQEDVRDFGGLIGVAADAQIHSPRDNVLNVNVIAQTKMTRAYAGMLEELSQDANIRTTLYVTHGQGEGLVAAPLVEEQWEAIVEEKKRMGRSGPEDDFHSWFPLAKQWAVTNGA